MPALPRYCNCNARVTGSFVSSVGLIDLVFDSSFVVSTSQALSWALRPPQPSSRRRNVNLMLEPPPAAWASLAGAWAGLGYETRARARVRPSLVRQLSPSRIGSLHWHLSIGPHSIPPMSASRTLDERGSVSHTLGCQASLFRAGMIVDDDLLQGAGGVGVETCLSTDSDGFCQTDKVSMRGGQEK